MSDPSGARRGDPPAVTVLIPTHNRPAWLQRAMNSVLGGQYEDFEVVVSNNGKPEDTREMERHINDARVRWTEQPQGTGVLENFRAALSHARGRNVAVLHDDDWWDPRLLATLVPALEAHPTAVAAFADHWFVTEDGVIDERSTYAASRASGRATVSPGLHQPFTALAVSETVPIPGCVFRREILAPHAFPDEVAAAIDVWAGYLLAVTGGALYVSRERLVYCTQHASSNFASASTENLLGATYCQRRMLRDPRMTDHRGDIERRLAAREQTIGAALLRRGNRDAARRYLSMALRRHLTSKGLAAWGASWVVPQSLLMRL